MIQKYAGYPAPAIYDEPGGEKVKQLLWGDWLEVKSEASNGWLQIRARNQDGWMRNEDVQDERLLELNFVDVGQGDGCFIVTPKDRRILVDAGRDDNMFWYLRWRFNMRRHPDWKIRIDDAIISHADEDHYEGFRPLFQDPHFIFENLYHQGLVDHADGDDRLGPKHPSGGHNYYTDIYATADALRKALPELNPSGRNLQYPSLLNTALTSDRVADVQSISTEDGYLPNLKDEQLSIRLLGPYLERPDGRPGLRRLGNLGVTKNGHSILGILTYGKLRVLLGGDLNKASMKLLLDVHSSDADGISPFEADIAKACHHGSSDVSPRFLQAVNAIATIISSGDEESYSHPRPDALGLLGKHGRGERPLIFSTELARSTRERVEHPQLLRALVGTELRAARREISATGQARSEKSGRDADRFMRAVSVYGMICVRTDGERVVIGQKLEVSSKGRGWDVHCLEYGQDGWKYIADAD